MRDDTTDTNSIDKNSKLESIVCQSYYDSISQSTSAVQECLDEIQKSQASQSDGECHYTQINPKFLEANNLPSQSDSDNSNDGTNDDTIQGTSKTTFSASELPDMDKSRFSPPKKKPNKLVSQASGTSYQSKMSQYTEASNDMLSMIQHNMVTASDLRRKSLAQYKLGNDVMSKFENLTTRRQSMARASVAGRSSLAQQSVIEPGLSVNDEAQCRRVSIVQQLHQTHKINESKNQPNNEFIMNITKEESKETIQNIKNFSKPPRVSANSELPNLDIEVYNYQRLSRVEHTNCKGSGVKDGLVNRVASDPELSTAAAAKIILPPVFVPKQFGVANYGGLTSVDGIGGMVVPAFAFNLKEHASKGSINSNRKTKAKMSVHSKQSNSKSFKQIAGSQISLRRGEKDTDRERRYTNSRNSKSKGNNMSLRNSNSVGNMKQSRSNNSLLNSSTRRKENSNKSNRPTTVDVNKANIEQHNSAISLINQSISKLSLESHTSERYGRKVDQQRNRIITTIMVFLLFISISPLIIDTKSEILTMTPIRQIYAFLWWISIVFLGVMLLINAGQILQMAKKFMKSGFLTLKTDPISRHSKIVPKKKMLRTSRQKIRKKREKETQARGNESMTSFRKKGKPT